MQSIKQKTSLLFVLRLLKMSISLLNLSLSAKYFGVSLERDAWILALGCILVLDQALWGAINETFRTKFIFIREQDGEEVALRKTFSMLFYTNLITVLVAIFIFCYPQLISKLIAPAFKGNQLLFLIKMVKIVVPTFLLNQLTQIGISVLNAYNSFFIPEIVSFISIIVNLFLLYFLAPKIGIFALVYSYYIGLFLLFILLLFEISRRKIPLFKYRSYKISNVYPFLLFALPYFAPYFFGQLNSLVEKSIASYIGLGTVSMLDYSRKFMDIPLGVLSSVMSTLLLPVLSLKYAQRKPKEFVTEFLNVGQMGILFMTFFIAILTSFPDLLISLLYRSGISKYDLHEIARLTSYFGIASIALFFFYLMAFSLLAMGKGKASAFTTIAIQIIMTVINLLFYRKLGIFIYPISLFVSHLIGAFLMFRKFRFKSRKLYEVAGKYLSFMVCVIVINLFMSKFIFSYLSTHNNLILLALNFSLLIGIFIVSTVIFKLEEIKLLKRITFFMKLK